MKTAYKNHCAVPTWKMSEILNHPYAQGIDGADYGPVKEELQSELWKRRNLEAEHLEAQHRKEQKEYLKHLATSHKRRKQA